MILEKNRHRIINAVRNLQLRHLVHQLSMPDRVDCFCEIKEENMNIVSCFSWRLCRSLSDSIAFGGKERKHAVVAESVVKTINQSIDRSIKIGGGATPGRARLNDLAGRSAALAPPCLLLCFGNSVNRKEKC